MEFYKTLSDYYDDLFPVDKSRIEFLSSCLKEDISSVLDIGSATGSTLIGLSNSTSVNTNEIDFTGIDMSQQMVNIARDKRAESKNIHFEELDMMDVGKRFSEKSFHLIFSLGNTLPHLLDDESIGKFFSAVYHILKPGGKFIIQLLNYDRILTKQIKELPVIEREEIIFKRTYENQKDKLKFCSDIEIKKTGDHLSSFTMLNPIKRDYLKKMLQQCGFKNIELYGNYKKEKITIDDYYSIFIVTR